MQSRWTDRSKPFSVLKSVGPKLVPFFKTLAIYFVLFGDGSRLESKFYCIIKCLPIISLIFFVLLHGMSFSEHYSYSRKILVGLICSLIGDALLVWKAHYFIHALLFFAFAQISYASAFGFRPAKLSVAVILLSLMVPAYIYVLPGLHGPMIYLVFMYFCLINYMAWRAIARVQLFEDLWTWTKLCGCAGAVFFLISDLVIAIDRFRQHLTYSHQLIMISYYAAQFGIALSVVDSQVDSFLKY